MTYNEKESSKRTAISYTNLACSDAVHLQEKLSLLLTQINNNYHLCESNNIDMTDDEKDEKIEELEIAFKSLIPMVQYALRITDEILTVSKQATEKISELK